MTIYRLVGAAEWDEARKSGVFSGSEHDRRDGFIHFSTADQLLETAEKHYAGRRDLVILFVDVPTVEKSLKWEPSRGGALFPHLYAPLPVTAVRKTANVTLNADGSFLLPPLDSKESNESNA